MNGIPILGVLPSSPAAASGLRFGDVLLSVNDQAMSTVEDFLRARSEAKGKMELLVRRGGHLLHICLELGAWPHQDPLATMKQVSQLARAASPESDRPMN